VPRTVREFHVVWRVVTLNIASTALSGSRFRPFIIGLPDRLREKNGHPPPFPPSPDPLLPSLLSLPLEIGPLNPARESVGAL